METHSSVLAWRIPWTEEPGGLQPLGSQELDMSKRLSRIPLHKGFLGMLCIEIDGKTCNLFSSIYTLTLRLELYGGHEGDGRVGLKQWF